MTIFNKFYQITIDNFVYVHYPKLAFPLFFQFLENNNGVQLINKSPHLSYPIRFENFTLFFKYTYVKLNNS